MKNVLIVANFASGLDEGVNSRITYLANMFSEHSNVELVASDFSHLKKKHRTENYSDYNYKVTLLHETGYKKNVCMKRFYSHYVWGNNVKKYLDKLDEKPDIIYCTVPSLTGGNKVVDYCEANNIKLVIDIQDLWPEAFEMIINIPYITNVIFKPFRKMADKIYSNADVICGVSDTYVKRALSVSTKDVKTKTVFLGTNLCDFDKNSKNKPILMKMNNEIWIGYCGTLGSSYDITCVIDALNLLIERGYTNLKFIVMGDGPKRVEFENYSKEKSLPVVYTGYLNYDEMCPLLCECDIAVNPINHGAAQSIINKHSDYTAAGLPIVSTQENQEFKRLIEEYKMGFNCNNNDFEDVADKIEILINSPDLKTTMGENARKCAEEKFDRRNSYNEIVSLILN